MKKHNKRNKTVDGIKKAKNNKKNTQKNNCITISSSQVIYKKYAVFSYLLVGVSFFYAWSSMAQSDTPSHFDLNYIDICAKQEEVTDPYSKKIILTDKTRPAVKKPKNSLNKKIFSIVKNTPMEKMVDDISERDRIVAALLVGIAMKESKFGIYSPKKNGRDCYNYWGYRGKENPTSSGYSCFDTPQQAVKIVGNRIESLVDQGASKPAQMVVWKCGYSCAGHSKASVQKWISDVSIHYHQIVSHNEIAKN